MARAALLGLERAAVGGQPSLEFSRIHMDSIVNISVEVNTNVDCPRPLWADPVRRSSSATVLPSLEVEADALRGRGAAIVMNDAGVIRAPWADVTPYAARLRDRLRQLAGPDTDVDVHGILPADRFFHGFARRIALPPWLCKSKGTVRSTTVVQRAVLVRRRSPKPSSLPVAECIAVRKLGRGGLCGIPYYSPMPDKKRTAALDWEDVR
jgi:hypothetical protein